MVSDSVGWHHIDISQMNGFINYKIFILNKFFDILNF